MFKTSLSLSCLFLMVAVASGTGGNSASHTVSLQGAKIPEDYTYNVYTYREPITQKNFSLAKRIGVRLSSDTVKYTHYPTYSGDHYYLVTTCDHLGKEKVGYGKDRMTGPYRLVDQIPPDQVQLNVNHINGRTVLSWESERLTNPEMIVSYNLYRSTSPDNVGRRNTFLTSIRRPLFDTSVSFTDKGRDDSGGIYYYSLRAVDKAGNLSFNSNLARSGNMPDLTICSSGSLTDNKDLSISKLYPVKGKKAAITATVRNIGLKESGKIRVTATVFNNEGKKVLAYKYKIETIVPGKLSIVSVPIKLGDTGKHRVSIVIDTEDSCKELNENNNTVSFTVHVVDRDYYFAWYGDPTHLKYINFPQTRKPRIEEWKRRGAVAGSFGGVHGEKLKDTYLRIAEAGYGGVLVDEIGGVHGDVKDFLAMLPEIKKKYPDFIIAVWLAAGIPPEIADLTKRGVIDLLMIERYISCSDDDNYKKILQMDITRARESGCIHKTIIGLGSSKGYSNYYSPGEHAEFLEKQIQFIRKEGPEMPGVGFFTAGTLPGVDAKLDEMCYKYFIRPQGEKK